MLCLENLDDSLFTLNSPWNGGSQALLLQQAFNKIAPLGLRAELLRPAARAWFVSQQGPEIGVQQLLHVHV